MNPPRWDSDTATKVREELLRRVAGPDAATARPVRPGPRRVAAQWQAVLATAAVLVVVIAVSLVALRLGGDRGVPASGGTSSAAVAPETPAETETLPPGKLLGRFTSADGPNQDHTIRPGGLAIATQFVCTGEGVYAVFVSGGTGESGDGPCSGGGVGAGGRGVAGTSHVRIRTQPGMRWTYTIIGIEPPEYVTPRPVPHPTDSSGTTVAYCTADALTARFDPVTASSSGFRPSGELVLTNRTDRVCALAGYPLVRFLDGDRPLGHHTMNQIDPRRSTDDGLRPVILAPGGSAWSQIDWYGPGDNRSEGPCDARTVSEVQVDLHYDLAAPAQKGTFSVPIGTATACLNGAHGALGRYGQISSTVFVDYSLNAAG